MSFSQGLSAVVDAKTLAEAILHAEKQEAVERKRRTNWRSARCDCCGLPLWCGNHAASEKHWTLERGWFGTCEWKGGGRPGEALLEVLCSVMAWSGENEFCEICTKTRTPWTKFIFADVVQSPWLLQAYEVFLDGEGIPGRHCPSWGRLLHEAWEIIDGLEPTEAVGPKMETSRSEVCESFLRDLQPGVFDELLRSPLFRRGYDIDWDRLHRELQAFSLHFVQSEARCASSGGACLG